MIDFRSLPKAHLHLHLEAGIRPATLAELAQRYGVRLPGTIGRNQSWADLGALYASICAVLRTPEDIERLIHEVVEDNASEGVVWIEPTFYAPSHAAVFGVARWQLANPA